MLRLLLSSLLMVVAFISADACQYCRMAATDPEAARMAAKMHAGDFPLDATINRLQPVDLSSVLTAPPTAGSVATSAADLPVAPRLAGTAVPIKKVAVPVSKWSGAAPGNVTWANTGLLGLLAAGGWFYWRTRREGAPVG